MHLFTYFSLCSAVQRAVTYLNSALTVAAAAAAAAAVAASPSADGRAADELTDCIDTTGKAVNDSNTLKYRLG